MGSSQCLCYFLETEASSRWLTRLREARARLSTRSDEKAGGWRVRKREKTSRMSFKKSCVCRQHLREENKHEDGRKTRRTRNGTRFVHIVHLWVSGVVRMVLVAALKTIYSIISSVLRMAVELSCPLTFSNFDLARSLTADLSWVSGCPEKKRREEAKERDSSKSKQLYKQAG